MACIVLAQLEKRNDVSGLSLPKGVKVSYRGSVSAIESPFQSCGFGLGMAMVLLRSVDRADVGSRSSHL